MFIRAFHPRPPLIFISEFSGKGDATGFKRKLRVGLMHVAVEALGIKCDNFIPYKTMEI